MMHFYSAPAGALNYNFNRGTNIDVGGAFSDTATPSNVGAILGVALPVPPATFMVFSSVADPSIEVLGLSCDRLLSMRDDEAITMIGDYFINRGVSRLSMDENSKGRMGRLLSTLRYQCRLTAIVAGLGARAQAAEAQMAGVQAVAAQASNQAASLQSQLAQANQTITSLRSQLQGPAVGETNNPSIEQTSYAVPIAVGLVAVAVIAYFALKK